MIKQVFGSFFRTIGRIIAYLAFGALLALIFQNKDVFAAESGYYKSNYRVYYETTPTFPGDYEYAGFNFTIDDFTASDFYDLGSQIDGNDLYGGFHLRAISGATSYTWEEGNLYTFRFTLDFYDEQSASRFDNFRTTNCYGGTTSSFTDGSSVDNIAECSYKIDDGSKENRKILYIYVKPATDLKYVHFYLRPKVLMSTGTVNAMNLPYGSVKLTYLKVTYNEGSNVVIEEQTIVIQEQTEKINQSIENLMNMFKENADKTEDIYLNDTENSDGTCGGILCNLKKVVKGVINFPQTILTAIVDGLKALFIPPDFTFLDDFRNSIENKLGFIAEVPMAIIDFTLNLATASWDEFNSISFPEIEIFGYKFWNSQEIDLTEAINIFKPFKYITDCLCVIICARTLNKWREKFTGGGD